MSKRRLPPTPLETGTPEPARPKIPFVARLALMSPLLLGVAGGAWRAATKWSRVEPEWAYYRDFVFQSLAFATGPDEKLFGYLPGAKALLTPFVRTEPLGYFVFLALSVAAIFILFDLIERCFLPPAPDAAGVRRRVFRLSVCLAAPSFLALQNNQLVSFSVCLAAAGVVLAFRNKARTAGLTLGVAILLKSLPLPLLGLLVLTGRFRAAFYALLAVGALSFSLASITDGIGPAIDNHIEWPHMVSEQNPLETFEMDVPRSLEANQSPLAFATKLAVWSGFSGLAFMTQGLVFLSLGALAVATFLLRQKPETRWLLAVVWMAWLPWAAPFGRYYYILYCAPLWCVAAADLRVKSPLLWLPLLVLPATPLFMLGHNPAFALVSLATFAIGLGMLARLIWPTQKLRLRTAKAPAGVEPAPREPGAAVALD